MASALDSNFDHGGDSDLALERATKVSKNKNENKDDILFKEQWLLQRNRKPLVRNKLVNSMDSWLAI